jgi:hypothetical protein
LEEVESLRNLAIENERVEGGVRTKDIFKKSATNRPLVTIITVAYNAEKYIDQTIRSVLKQTFYQIHFQFLGYSLIFPSLLPEVNRHLQ